MLLQAVCGRLAWYEDVNDAERLSYNSAMRWLAGGKATDRGAALLSQMGRFEAQWLAAHANLSVLGDLSGLWIDRVHGRKPRKHDPVVARHRRYVNFHLAEVEVPYKLFANILERIDRLRPKPVPT